MMVSILALRYMSQTNKQNTKKFTSAYKSNCRVRYLPSSIDTDVSLPQHITLNCPELPPHLFMQAFIIPCHHSVKYTRLAFVFMFQTVCYSQDCCLWGNIWDPFQLQEHASDCGTETQTSGRTLGVSQPCRQGCHQHQNCKHRNHSHRTPHNVLTARWAERDWLAATTAS
jgi:hypothetical protein